MSAVKIEQNDGANRPQASRRTFCLVQITRTGDLLQVLQAVQYFRYEHPDVRLILVAREQFYRPVAFLLDTYFDAIHLLDGKTLAAPTLHESANALKPFLNKLAHENIEVLANLSYSKSSTYLSSIIPARKRIGPHYDKLGKVIIPDGWSQFVYSNVLTGPHNPFSLVDLYKKVIGVKNKMRPKAADRARSEKIVVHAFASSAKKRWRHEKWSEVIYRALKDFPKHEIILVGGKADLPEAEKLMASPSLARFLPRIISYVGTHSPQDVFAALKDAALFIGHDSMVGHLAAIAGTPSLTISLGPVRPQETTPYGNNSYCISAATKCHPCFPDTPCDFYQCHVDIPHQAVAEVVNSLLTHGEVTRENLKAKISQFHLANVIVSKGEFTDNNLWRAAPLNATSSRPHDVLRPLYRTLWLYVLSQSEEKAPIPEIGAQAMKDFQDLAQGLQQLFELCHYGKKYCTYILQEISSPTPALKKIKDYSDKIDEIDKLLEMIKARYEPLSPIVNFHLISKSNILGNNLVELSENTFISFDSMAGHVTALYELIDTVASDHKTRQKNAEGPKATNNV